MEGLLLQNAESHWAGRVGDGGSPPQRAIPGRRPHVDSLRRKFAKLYIVHMGPGETTIPPEEARAIQIASVITERANVGNEGRVEGDAEDPFAEEVSEEDDESPSTNVAVAVRPLVLPRQARESSGKYGDDLL